MNAFAYLIWTSARNRFLGTLKRVRSPRYAIALIVGALYIWSFFFRPIRQGGPASMSFFLTRPAEAIITLLVVLMLMSAWVFGTDTTALAFTEAEVSFLFAGPVSRRQLIQYKLFRAQIAVLFNVLIWVFILRRGGTLLPAPFRAVGLWILFSTLNMHRLGAALVRSSVLESATAGAKRNWWSIAFFALVGLALGAGLLDGRAELRTAEGFSGFFKVLTNVLTRAPAEWGLYPFHLVIAPTFAASISAWSRAILPALGVLIAHTWWVLRTDAAFEDAALVASAERTRRIQAMRERRALGATTAPKPPAKTVSLASVGHPAVAIFWKNILCLRRTTQLRVFIAPLVLALAIGAGMSDGITAGPLAMVATDALALAGALLLFGGRLIRNDLRHDMQHLPLIKTLPVEPRDIVLAEVASSALPMAAVQIVLVTIAYAALFTMPTVIVGPQVRFALFVSAPLALIAINGALVTIQNATAVLFPAWVRLGPTVSTGVEALGQNLLATMANFLALALALVVPTLIALVTIVYLHATGAFALAVVVTVSAIVLFAETYGVMMYLGQALAKAEPLQTA